MPQVGFVEIDSGVTSERVKKQGELKAFLMQASKYTFGHTFV